MKCFFRFVIAAHRGGARLTEGDVTERLIEDGFEEKTAEHLATIYHYGREILKQEGVFPGSRGSRETQHLGTTQPAKVGAHRAPRLAPILTILVAPGLRKLRLFAASRRVMPGGAFLENPYNQGSQ